MKFRLSVSEVIIAISIFCCIIISLYLEANSSRNVHWRSFMFHYLISSVLVFVGLLYRITGRSYRLASVLIGAGFFTAFTNAGVKLNYLLSPTTEGNIDAWLAKIDSSFGFNWVEYVLQFEGRPTITWLLSVIYQSSLFQLLCMILILGFSGRSRNLENFFLVGIGSSLISITIWSLWPSFGPAILKVPDNIFEKIDLVINSDYVNHLKAVSNGLVIEINPQSIRGLIAFPSMHTVMALMSLYFSWKSYFFKYFFVLNLFMPFAIILHGGHHLVDVVGGIVVFWLVLSIVIYTRMTTDRLFKEK